MLLLLLDIFHLFRWSSQVVKNEQKNEVYLGSGCQSADTVVWVRKAIDSPGCIISLAQFTLTLGFLSVQSKQLSVNSSTSNSESQVCMDAHHLRVDHLSRW